MAFKHGTATKVYYHSVDMSDYVEEVEPSLERELAEYAPLSASWKSSLPGLRSMTLALTGLYNAEDGGSADLAWARFDASTKGIFALLPDGDVDTYDCYVGEGFSDSHSVPTSATDIVRLPVGVVGSDNVDRAVVIHALAEETASGSGTGVDNTAATALGCRAYLICTDLDATSLDVTLEDSPNNLDWTLLATFTQLLAVGSEMQEVAAAATTPDRYVRVTYVLTGGNTSATFFVAWIRLS
ncbi:MAG: hypothetical protein ABIH46_03120 [Chloroflexota bacterium]